jgi:hypothetical protein
MRKFLDIIEAKYLRHLPYILGAVTVFVCSSFLAGALLKIRADRPNTTPLSETATVVVFEPKTCAECNDFRTQIGRPHQSSALAEKVPLRYYDISDGVVPKRYSVSRGFGSEPTAVVFDIFGREQARIVGLPSDLEDFQRRLMPHVRRAERDMLHVASRGAAQH